ncbi:hypothetical protein Vretifemale_14292, partial [Volvox reticuliferus]
YKHPNGNVVQEMTILLPKGGMAWLLSSAVVAKGHLRLGQVHLLPNNPPITVEVHIKNLYKVQPVFWEISGVPSSLSPPAIPSFLAQAYSSERVSWLRTDFQDLKPTRMADTWRIKMAPGSPSLPHQSLFSLGRPGGLSSQGLLVASRLRSVVEEAPFFMPCMPPPRLELTRQRDMLRQRMLPHPPNPPAQPIAQPSGLDPSSRTSNTVPSFADVLRQPPQVRPWPPVPSSLAPFPPGVPQPVAPPPPPIPQEIATTAATAAVARKAAAKAAAAACKARASTTTSNIVTDPMGALAGVQQTGGTAPPTPQPLVTNPTTANASPQDSTLRMPQPQTISPPSQQEPPCMSPATPGAPATVRPTTSVETGQNATPPLTPRPASKPNNQGVVKEVSSPAGHPRPSRPRTQRLSNSHA